MCAPLRIQTLFWQVYPEGAHPARARKASAVAGLPRRFDVGELVVHVLQTAGVLADEDAGPRGGRPGAAEGVVPEDQVVVVAVDDDGARRAVVEDAVVLENVAVGAHRLTLVAEQHAGT